MCLSENKLKLDILIGEKMRIVVNDIAASKTGALSVLKDFYDCVLANDKENEWIFILGDDLLQEKDNIKIILRKDVKAGWGNRLKFELLNGAEFLEDLKPDVVLSLQNTMPRNYRGKQVLYVHQPLGYQDSKSFSLFKRTEREYAIYQKFISILINNSVKAADRVIVQTEWMREAVSKKTGIAVSKISKVLPMVNIPEDLNIDVETYREKYGVAADKELSNFFFPAGPILYKNHECILEASEILVKKGITDFTVSFTVSEDEVPYLKHKSLTQVRYLGKISRQEVFERYKYGVLIFPSYIETFGYPPAEARAVGGLVFASDCPFSREVLKDYKDAYYFDPFNPAELAKLMEQTIRGLIVKRENTENIVKDNDVNTSWLEVINIVKEVGMDK